MAFIYACKSLSLFRLNKLSLFHFFELHLIQRRNAWALSNAGMIPSSFAKLKAASNASSSVALRKVARPFQTSGHAGADTRVI
jgi:hypothetical protein